MAQVTIQVEGFGPMQVEQGTDAQMAAQIEANIAKGGGGATPAPATATSPSASGPTVEAPKVPGAWGPQTLSETLKQMGSEMDPISKLGSGVAQSFERTGRALGLPHAIQAITGKPMDTEGEGFKGLSEGTGILGTAGDVAGSVTQGIRATSLLGKALPQSVINWAARNPRLAAYLGTSAGAGATTAAMTPGDVGERLEEGGKAAALSLPLTAAARMFAQPAKMSQVGKELHAATGDVPPLHVGAESKLLQDVGDVVKGIPAVGAPLHEGERRIFNAGNRQLWQQATPPGKPNLLANTNAGEVNRGQLFRDLKQQFDDVYDALLKPARIQVNNADRSAITKIIDKNLVPEDAARVHKLLAEQFPQHSRRMGGREWKHLQEIIRDKAASYGGSGDAIQKDIGKVYAEIDKHLVTMRNRSVTRTTARKLDATDNAYAVRKLFEKAVGSSSEGAKGLNPKLLADALIARTSEGGIARAHGVGQQVVDPMYATLGAMKEPTTPTSLWQLQRLAGLLGPRIMGATGLGWALGGPLGASIPLVTAGSMNLIGSGARGARAMYGDYAPQKALADFLRRSPAAIPGATAGLTSQE